MLTVEKTMITQFRLFLIFYLFGASISYDTRYRRSVGTVAQITSTPKIPLSCEEGWFSFGDMCYKRFGETKADKLTWNEASDSCRKDHDGTLVTINSQELQDFLTAFVMLSGRARMWIGLHDRRNESVYEWEDGTPVNYTHWAPWSRSDPNSPQKDCIEVIPHPLMSNKKIAVWAERSCGYSYQYVCQKTKEVQRRIYPDPKYCSSEEGGGWKFESSCFHLVTQKMTWSDAEEYCVQHHDGHLATILDFAVHFYLSYVFRDVKHAWIGIKVNPDEDPQKWSSGWFALYEDWRSAEIDPPVGCSIFVPKKKWRHDSCSKKMPFICERSSVVAPTLKPGLEGSSCPTQPEGWKNLGGDRCYFFDTRAKLSWQDANFKCHRKGGTLASILSLDEVNILRHFVRYDSTSDHDLDISIGLYRKDPSGELAWADGSPVDFLYWGYTDPNTKTEHCSVIKRNTFRFHVFDCTTKRGYICTALKTRGGNSATKVDDSRFSMNVGTLVGLIACTLIAVAVTGIAMHRFGTCCKWVERSWIPWRRFPSEAERIHQGIRASELLAMEDEEMDYEKILFHPQLH